jgi:hypothetical protein
MKRPDEERGSGEKRKRRQRQFEDSRGLSGRRELPLDEATAENPEAPRGPAGKDEPSADEGKQGSGGGAP